MLGEHLGREADGLLGGDGAVGPNLHGQFVVVGDLADAGVVHGVVDLQDRRIDAVHRQNVQIVLLHHQLLVALSGDIAPAFVEGDLHHELAAFVQGGDVPFGVQHLDLIALDAASSNFTLTVRLDAHGDRAVGVELGGNAFDVQNDLGHVFLDAGDGAELVNNAVDLNAGDGNTRKRREQHTP